jgi:hypothetical protein
MHRTRLTRLAAAVASALILVGLIAVPAQASSLARITGTIVAAEAGRPVGTGQVLAERLNVADGTSIGAFTPTFSFQLPAGTYRLRFESDNTGDVNSVSPWFWKGATSYAATTTIKVTAGHTLRLGNIVIPAGASIAGVKPAGREILAYDSSGARAGRSGFAGAASTAYEIRGLRAGDYRVGTPATSTMFASYWEGARSRDAGTPVSLAAGERRDGIDLTADPYAVLSGAVSQPAEGGGLAAAVANVFLFDADSGERVSAVIAPSTKAGGAWSLSVPPGRYKLWFRSDPFLHVSYGSAWYGGSDRAEATVIEVADDDIAGLDGTLVPIGAAKVTQTGGRDLFDVEVYRHDSDGSWYSLLGGLGFDPDHVYGWPDTGLVPALPAGEYTLRYAYASTIKDPASPPMFLGGSADAEHAQTFTVTAGATTAVALTVTDAPYRPGLRDVDGDGHSDIFMRNSTGALYVAYGDGAGGIRGTALVTSAIPASTRLFIGGDFTRGGDLDVIGRTSAGALVHYWNLAGVPLSAPVSPAPYWKAYTWFAATDDFTGDGEPDFFGRDRDNRLVVCHGQGHDPKCVWSYPAGHWTRLGRFISPGDFDGDGHPDLLARDSSSRLWLYSGDGHGGFLPGRTLVASHWNSHPVLSPGDFDGDGHPDIVVLSSVGNLWLYPGDGNGGLLPKALIASGWSRWTPVV